jgi:pyruvate/2-oxoglutarate dehydrogenase complex dihydrolipoamide acyltransferase (E2) component
MSALSPLSPRDIQAAVVAWHNRHPLAQRIDADRVHSIGWVALPFLRPPTGVEPSLDGGTPAPPFAAAAPAPGWRRWWPWTRHEPGGSRPVFSEAFIDGVSAKQAAAFALRHGLNQPPTDHEAWPQRRIAVDVDLAEQSAGGWPSEFWVLSAAIDNGDGRCRVLIAPDGLSVLGPRQWHRGRLAVAAALGALVLAGLAWVAWPSATSPSPSSAPVAASAPHNVPASAMAPASAAEPAPMAAREAAREAAAFASGAPATMPVASGEDAAASEPDIRPQLVKPLPNRRGPPPRPILADRDDRPATAPAGAVSAPGALPDTPRPSDATAPAPSPATAPYRGAATPEQIRPGLPAQGPLIALVSPGFRQRAEAEAMLVRMTEHLKATMAQQTGLRAEVVESPEGWRAAVYPFATREEAAILNATMVARGWRTRSVTF